MAGKPASGSSASASGAEKRQARRRPILDTFSLFIVVPRKGVHRLQVHDASDLGLGFSIDMEGETIADFPLKQGDAIEVLLYLNQSLNIPLGVEVARIENENGMRRIGAQFKDRTSRTYQAYLAFLAMLDGIIDVARIDKA